MRQLTASEWTLIDHAFWASVKDVPERTMELAAEALMRTAPKDSAWINRVSDDCAKLTD